MLTNEQKGSLIESIIQTKKQVRFYKRTIDQLNWQQATYSKKVNSQQKEISRLKQYIRDMRVSGTAPKGLVPPEFMEVYTQSIEYMRQFKEHFKPGEDFTSFGDMKRGFDSGVITWKVVQNSIGDLDLEFVTFKEPTKPTFDLEQAPIGEVGEVRTPVRRAVRF